jgi:hypothetical protein
MGKSMLTKLGGIGVAIIVALGFFAFNTFKEKAGAPEVGECVVLSGSADNADVDTKKCGSDSVLWKVVADDGACDETELNYSVTLKGTTPVDLCLYYDVAVGDCLQVTDDLSTPDEKVACTTKSTPTTFVMKVASIDTKTSAGTCGEQALPIANKKRGSTLCFEPVA